MRFNAKMKLDKLFFNLCMILVFILVTSVYVTATMTVEKEIDDSKIKTGEQAQIKLTFDNKYDSDILVQIVDKNIFGQNGLDIQCLEYKVPKGKTSIAYDPITVVDVGDYTLGSANVIFKDPTGKDVEIKSNTLDIEVTKGKTIGGMQSLSTIYQCNGQNMKSTSMTMSSQQQNGQQNNNQGNQNGQQKSMDEQMMEQLQKMQQQSNQQQKQQQVQNNQINQDAGALKQQMDQKKKEYEQQMQNIANELGKQEEFTNAHQEMLDNGYQLQNANIEPENNNTGNFEMNYQRPNGEKASIRGEMKDGKLSHMEQQSQELTEQMMSQLQQNPEFQKFSEELKQDGFNISNAKKVFDGNKTQAQIDYSRMNSFNETKKANITADFLGTNVTNVEMQKEEDNEDKWYGYLWLIPIIVLIFIGYFIYNKYFKKKKEVSMHEDKKVEKPIDYFSESTKMLNESIRFFDKGQGKDAYELASYAIRFYCSHKLGLRRELTNSETTTYVRDSDWMDNSKLRRALNLCGMVEFAKYKENKKDFDEIICVAKEIIKK